MREKHCGHINEQFIGKTLTTCGWVFHHRDHGGVIFIDLWDHTGILQVVVNPDSAYFSVAESLRKESVIEVTGEIRQRPEGTVNENMTTGQVELVVNKMVCHNLSEPVPFTRDEIHKVSEEVRYRHRYLDLRSEKMQHNLRFRSKLNHFFRDFLDRNQFVEVETPHFTKATPEGARDYIVPSRVHNGQCYALPQSPQTFKQLLMVSGMDRYFQIARCFRDEDLRADRQPEFTQLDLEMAFVDESDVMNLTEGMIREAFDKLINVKLPKFDCYTYDELLESTGSDRPDLRNPLRLVNIKDDVIDSEFKVFSAAAKGEGSRSCCHECSTGL